MAAPALCARRARAGRDRDPAHSPRPQLPRSVACSLPSHWFLPADPLFIESQGRVCLSAAGSARAPVARAGSVARDGTYFAHSMPVLTLIHLPVRQLRSQLAEKTRLVAQLQQEIKALKGGRFLCICIVAQLLVLVSGGVSPASASPGSALLLATPTAAGALSPSPGAGSASGAKAGAGAAAAAEAPAPLCSIPAHQELVERVKAAELQVQSLRQSQMYARNVRDFLHRSRVAFPLLAAR
jgi:hypothetical protein